jgi:hypothetical protein
MSKEFEIARDVELTGSADAVFAAITKGSGGWLWPVEYGEVGEPRPEGTVTVWDPPRHLIARAESDGWYNSLEFLIETDSGGTARLHYVHSGIIADDWDNQYDGISEHTDFYLHTLGQYLRYFPGAPAAYTSGEGPDAAKAADSLERVRDALGLAGAAPGDTVQLELDGPGKIDGVVDYLTPHFIGIRTGDTMYRFFGRNAWGGTVGFSAHLFAPGADAEATGQQWRDWLNSLFA